MRDIEEPTSMGNEKTPPKGTKSVKPVKKEIKDSFDDQRPTSECFKTPANFKKFYQRVMASDNGMPNYRIRVAKQFLDNIQHDPTYLCMPDIQSFVKSYALDAFPQIREIMLEAIDCFLRDQTDKFDEFYDILKAGLNDKSIPVRRKAIHVLANYCEYNIYSEKIPEILYHVALKSRYEDKLAKSVATFFARAWYNGTKDVVKWTLDLVCFVGLLNRAGFLELFRELGAKLPESLKDHHQAIIACLLDFLGQGTGKHVLITLNECLKFQMADIQTNSERLQPLLDVKRLETSGALGENFALIGTCLSVINKASLAALEKEILGVLVKRGDDFVEDGVELLSKVVEVTGNVELVKKAIKYCSDVVENLLNDMEANPDDDGRMAMTEFCRRTVRIFAVLIRSFGDPDDSTKTLIFLMRLLNAEDKELQRGSLLAMGIIGTRYPEEYLNEHITNIYQAILLDKNEDLRVQVLSNIQMILENAEKFPTTSMVDILKPVFQKLLPYITEAYLTNDIDTRKTVFKIIFMIIYKGIVEYQRVFPMVMCMTTDIDQRIAKEACVVFEEFNPQFEPTTADFLEGVKIWDRFEEVLLKWGGVSRFYESARQVGAHHAFTKAVLRDFLKNGITIQGIRFNAKVLATAPYDADDIDLVIKEIHKTGERVMEKDGMTSGLLFALEDYLHRKKGGTRTSSPLEQVRMGKGDDGPVRKGRKDKAEKRKIEVEKEEKKSDEKKGKVDGKKNKTASGKRSSPKRSKVRSAP